MSAESPAVAALERTVTLLEAYGSTAARRPIDPVGKFAAKLEASGLELGEGGDVRLRGAAYVEALRGFGRQRERHFGALELTELLVSRQLDVENQIRAVTHLAGGCGPCWSTLGEVTLRDPQPTLDPVLRATRTLVAPELSRLSPGALWALDQARSQPLAVCRLILEHGLELAQERPERPLESVLQAVLPTGSALFFATAEPRADLFSLLHIFLAEGAHLAGFSGRALDHLVEALSYLPQGSRGEIEARLLELRSRLALAAGDFRHAPVFVEAALTHLHGERLNVRRAEALCELGFLLTLCGDLARARERLWEARALVSKIEPSASPSLRRSILHNLAQLDVELAFGRGAAGCSRDHLLRTAAILLPDRQELRPARWPECSRLGATARDARDPARQGQARGELHDPN